jgi:hypothetical protein
MHLKRRRVVTELPTEYTRVTNPERLRPLHDFALQLLSILATEYDVGESEEFEIIPRIMGRLSFARPPITLTPNSSIEAPISIAFTSFPGLILRCGRFLNAPFPICGCDQCAETLDGETERLRGILDCVVMGNFLEEVELPIFGTAHGKWRLGDINAANGVEGGGISFSRDHARELQHAGLKRIQWKPWSTRVLRVQIDRASTTHDDCE